MYLFTNPVLYLLCLLLGLSMDPSSIPVEGGNSLYAILNSRHCSGHQKGCSWKNLKSGAFCLYGTLYSLNPISYSQSKFSCFVSFASWGYGTLYNRRNLKSCKTKDDIGRWIRKYSGWNSLRTECLAPSSNLLFMSVVVKPLWYQLVLDLILEEFWLSFNQECWISD